MARKKKCYYHPTEQAHQLAYYQSLPEKQQRYFLAHEYLRLGVGSQSYLASIFKCSRQRIVNGVQELSQLDFQPDYTFQRKPGGGRKKRS